MQKIFDFDGPLMTFLKKIFDLFVVNILWVICSIPIFTIGAATTAAYYTCFKAIRKEDGYVIKTFFKAFRGNFKQATVLWLIGVFAVALISLEIVQLFKLSLIGTTMGNVLLCVFGISAIIVVCALIYVFAVQAFFDNTIKNTIKNSLILGMSNLGYTLLMIGLDLVLGGITLIFAPIFCPILHTYINAIFIYKIFKKYLPQDENSDEEYAIEVEV